MNSVLHVTLGLWAGAALEFRPPVNAARLFAKDKYLEPMFGDVGQAQTKAAMLLLMIATTSSRTCTKPIVTCSTFSQNATYHKDEAFSIIRLRFVYTPSYSVFANRKAGEA